MDEMSEGLISFIKLYDTNLSSILPIDTSNRGYSISYMDKHKIVCSNIDTPLKCCKSIFMYN